MDYRKTIAVVAVIAVILCGCYFYMPDKEKETPTISGDVIGTDIYENLMVSFTAEDMLDRGFSYGDYVTIEVGDYDLKSVEFIEGLDSSSYFSVFISKGEGSARIGVFSGPAIVANDGEEVKVTYDGKNEGYHYMEALKKMATDPDMFTDMKDYANFFELTGGDLAQGRVFRSYSIIKDADVPSKSYYADQLSEQYGVNYLIMLPYSEADLKNVPDWFEGTYGEKLIKEGKYITLDMRPADMFNNPEKTKELVSAIIENEGPYMLFCECGKDRTGLMSIIVQGIAGASNEEIRSSYMKAFENLYLLEEGTDTYKAVQGNTYEHMIYLIAHPEMGSKPYLVDWADIDVSDIDVSAAVMSYLKGTIGLTDEQISLAREHLTSQTVSQPAWATGSETGLCAEA